jgi:hypothetical protein
VTPTLDVVAKKKVEPSAEETTAMEAVHRAWPLPFGSRER